MQVERRWWQRSSAKYLIRRLSGFIYSDQISQQDKSNNPINAFAALERVRAL